MSASKNVKRFLLDIPPRLQWTNGHGYCGETSVQCIGLYYGCWISQNLTRSINEGEFLLTNDENDADTLDTLHFNFERWNFEREREPQIERYCAWLKQHLIRQHPCIIAVYVNDVDDKSDEYDHIMPAIGIEYSGADDRYDSHDTMLCYSLLNLKLLERQLNKNDMIKTRIECEVDAEDGGCLPQKVNYGYAILGIKDDDRVTVPVRLKVNVSEEPNISMGTQPIMMQGTVTVFNLVPDHKYTVLRYNSYKKVPTSGNAKSFLRSNYHSNHGFVANSSTYTYVDPEEIPSNGSTYYRCVPIEDSDH